MMHYRIAVLALAAAAMMPLFAAPKIAATGQEKKDYLTEEEADKIRDADSPSERIKLYIAFAEDRLTKFQYELTRQNPDRRKDEMLNGLMNAYAGCMDDASDQIDVAKQKQVDIHAALKIMAGKGKGFLEILQKLDKGSGPDFESYKETLEDAIEGTTDALTDTENAQKEMLPPPVRRKPN
jgi:hypothetical protein